MINNKKTESLRDSNYQTKEANIEDIIAYKESSHWKKMIWCF